MGKKLYQFTFLHQPRLFASEDIARGVEKKVDELDGIHRSALTSVTSIRESKDLTAKGKQTALKELEAEIVKKTKEWQQGNVHYDNQAKLLERDMKPKRHRPDDIVWELQQREIRDHFRKLDPIMQEAAYREAAAVGNDLLLSAIEESPIPFVFATQGQIDKIQFQRLETQYPKQAARLRDLQLASQQADSSLNAVRDSLLKSGLEIVGVDPVQELATT